MSKDLVISAMLISEAAKGGDFDWETKKVFLEGSEDYELGMNDYRKWEEVIRAEIKERGIDPTNRDDFMDIVCDVLDNDPKLDAIEVDDKDDLLDRIAERLYKKVGKAKINESVGGYGDDVDGADFSKWIRAIRDEAKELELNINTKRNFDTLALELLDNDPLMDTLDDPEAAKLEIVNALWHKHNASAAGIRAKRKLRPKKRLNKEEEEVRTLPKLKTAQNVVPSSEMRRMMSAAYRKGREGSKDVCPYPKNTTHSHLWNKAYKRGADAAKYEQFAQEENEEVDTSMSARKEGFAACAQSYAEVEEGEEQYIEMINPYEEGSAEASAYEEGWLQCQEVLDAMGGDVDTGQDQESYAADDEYAAGDEYEADDEADDEAQMQVTQRTQMAPSRY